MKENNEVFCSVDWKAVGRLLPSRAVYPLFNALNALFDSFAKEPCWCYRWDWTTFLGCFLLKLPILGVSNLYSYRFHLPLNLSWRYFDTGTPCSFAPFWIRLNVALSVLKVSLSFRGLVLRSSIFRCLLVAVSVKFLLFLVLDVLGWLPFFQVFNVFGFVWVGSGKARPTRCVISSCRECFSQGVNGLGDCVFSPRGVNERFFPHDVP